VFRNETSPAFKLEKETLMKKHAATLLILMLAGLTGLVYAQTATTIIAQVPFDYFANGKAMLAGECRVRIENDGQPIMRIAAERESVIALPHASESRKASANTVLIFHQYGDRYFLAGVSRQGQNVTYELPAGKLERELRAQNATEKNVTMLASLQ
jgi:hypothetical protein